MYIDVDNGTVAYSESDPIIDLYPKNLSAGGSMGGVDMSSVRSTISALSRAGHKARETIQGADPVDFLVRALK